MSYYMFLDDIRDPVSVTWVKMPKIDNCDWKIVRNYNEFVKCIEEFGLPKFITFDHDLADEHYFSTGYVGTSYREYTGYDCAKWLIEYCMDNNVSLPACQVHSMNPAGKKNIEMLLSNFGRAV